MARQDKIGTHATTHIHIDGKTIVTYHKTPVVTVDVDGTITLNSGGWRSSTTKTRMNQAASQLNLGFRVYQRDFDWFVKVDASQLGLGFRVYQTNFQWHACAGTLPFGDGMRFRVDLDARRTA
jgi:hypothetical protein|tara:strand:+ start:85 stop:453 length:369 start_codon:yes stop_codon:yes gene_type:complete